MHAETPQTTSQKTLLQSLTRSELAALLEPVLATFSSAASGVSKKNDADPEKKQRNLQKQAALRATQIYRWVYQRFVWDWDGMSDLSLELRQWLKQNIAIHQLETAMSKQSEDGTMKFLWRLADSKTIESVIIPAAIEDSKRLTVCISSQVGCAMKCGFCLTGVQGFDRHLKAYEIVSQVMHLRQLAPITNIVFMGMGEPLHNLDNVVQAIKIILDQEGMNFSKRKVTVSTSGIVPAIERLAAETGVMLAVSLNATTDTQRSQIMPVNDKWNIRTLLEACQKYPAHSYKRVTYEYVLIRDFNDTQDDARRLHKLVSTYPAKINLIPFNEHPGAAMKRPDDSTVDAFHRYLVERRVVATVRRSRGRDILAACGQLRSLFGTARGTDKHQDSAYRGDSSTASA